MYKSKSEHDHTNTTATRRLTKAAQAKIQEFVALGLSTNLIWTKYARNHLSDRTQLYNYLARLKRQKNEELIKLSYGDFDKWCAQS